MNTITREKFEVLQQKYQMGDCPDGTPLYDGMLRMFNEISGGRTVMTEEKVEEVFVENIRMNDWLNFANGLWEDEA